MILDSKLSWSMRDWRLRLGRSWCCPRGVRWELIPDRIALVVIAGVQGAALAGKLKGRKLVVKGRVGKKGMAIMTRPILLLKKLKMRMSL